MSANQPVAPSYGTGQTVSPAAASATTPLVRGTNQLVLTNLGAGICYIRVGTSGMPPATVADYPIPAGAQVVITKGQDQDTLAHISAAGTSLHIMNGEGF